jgi:hypothetical protein
LTGRRGIAVDDPKVPDLVGGIANGRKRNHALVGRAKEITEEVEFCPELPDVDRNQRSAPTARQRQGDDLERRYDPFARLVSSRRHGSAGNESPRDEVDNRLGEVADESGDLRPRDFGSDRFLEAASAAQEPEAFRHIALDDSQIIRKAT